MELDPRSVHIGIEKVAPDAQLEHHANCWNEIRNNKDEYFKIGVGVYKAINADREYYINSHVNLDDNSDKTVSEQTKDAHSRHLSYFIGYKAEVTYEVISSDWKSTLYRVTTC